MVSQGLDAGRFDVSMPSHGPNATLMGRSPNWEGVAHMRSHLRKEKNKSGGVLREAQASYQETQKKMQKELKPAASAVVAAIEKHLKAAVQDINNPDQTLDIHIENTAFQKLQAQRNIRGEMNIQWGHYHDNSQNRGREFVRVQGFDGKIRMFQKVGVQKAVRWIRVDTRQGGGSETTQRRSSGSCSLDSATHCFQLHA